MKIALTKLYLFFITFSLMIILAYFSFGNDTFNHVCLDSPIECSDLSNQFEYSQPDCFEDDSFTNDSKSKLNDDHVCVQLIPAFNDMFQNNYTSFIWQPPKFL